VDKRVALDREGAADKQCQGEGNSDVITNREEGKGKPPRLFPKTGYPEPALQQKTEERESVYCRCCVCVWSRMCLR